MIADLQAALLTATAVGAGLVAGLFVAFSIAVMPALGGLAPVTGIAVMQAVNRVILNPLFLVLYLGTAIGCVVLAATSGGAPLVLIGAGVYLLGAFVVTSLVNVPLNKELDAAGPDDLRVWQRFRRRWTLWNHVRAGAALAGAVLLVMA